MNKLSKTLFLLLVILLLISVVACPDGSGPQGLPGTYSLEGTNPDGSPYRGTVTIKQEEESYSVEWNIAGQKTTGSGQLDGETLTVDWGQQSPMIYQIQEEGARLHGTWAGGQGSETLTRQSPATDEQPEE
ncbi:MAG: fibronectin-binding protein [Leptospiraceae bacterium]|nr:fibronectin-binding protein [Leptospiraceae bacterium]